MTKWWVGGVVAVVMSTLLIGLWQSVHEQQRLAQELMQLKTAFVHLKDDNTSLGSQLTQLRQDLTQAQTQRDDVMAKLTAVETQLSTADGGRQQAEMALQTAQEQARLWRTEKTLLEGRIATLLQEKATLEEQLSASEPARRSSTSSNKSSSRIMPPTAGQSPSSGTGGNKGYVVHILPDPSAHAASAAPSEAPRR